MQFKDDWPLLNKRVGLLLERSQGRGVGGGAGGGGRRKDSGGKEKVKIEQPHHIITSTK